MDFGISTAALPPEQLNNAIQDKAKQLQEIHTQLQETQKNLQETEEKSRTLQQELKRINNNVNQLGLNIKASELNIDKLNLEIDSLEYDIEKTGKKMDVKRRGIDQILRELQAQGAEDQLIVFLKNKTLAEGLAESESLGDIKSQLADEVGELQILKSELTENLETASRKKSDIENEQRNLKIRKSLVEEEKKERQQLLTTTKSQEKIYQQIIDELAKKQIQIAEEVEALEAELRAQIAPSALPARRPGVLSWPIAGGRVTQNYGATSFARSRYGYRGKWHNGVDIGAPLGTPITAPAEGIVVNTGDQDRYCRRGAYGKYAVLRHPNNLVTLYAHLSRTGVEPGTRVNQGDLLGYVGNTGYSRGAHLHFTVYDGKTFQMRPSKTCGPMPSGGDINPLDYLNATGVALYWENLLHVGGDNHDN